MKRSKTLGPPLATGLVVLLLLVGPTAVGRAGAQADPEQELAERFAPVMMLKAQTEPCDGEGEQYAPAAVEVVLDNPEVLLRQVGSGNPVIMQGPGAADVFGLGQGFYLDFPGDALAPGCIYETDFRRYTEGVPPVVYAHVAQQADAPGQLALQYWFFWYYNDYNNLHEGDWEGIQLLFDVATVEEALQAEPVSVGYGQHFGGERADWDDEKLELRGSRPVVYSAVGSHASYFESTLYLGRSGSQGFGCDNTEGPFVEIDPEVVVLPDSVDDPADPLAWLAFEGRWGERQGGPFNGTTGPGSKGRWTNPIDWHDDLRSSSVAVPGGAETDTPIVSTFCDVVASGSARYIQLQQNPLGLLAGLAVAAVGAVLIVRRTSWRPVPAIPVISRRRAGEIIVAAANLNRRRPGQILQIGVVYFVVAVVVGVLTAGVQWLVLLTVPDSSETNLGVVGVVIVGVLAGISQTTAFTIVTAAVAAYLLAVERGDAVRGWDGYREVMARRGDLAAGLGRAITVVVGLAITIVGIPWAIWRLVGYQFLAQTTMVEGLRGRAALDRSTKLVSGRWFHTALIVIVLGAVVSLTNVVVGLLLLFLLSGLPLWLFSVLVTAAAAAVAPFSAIGNVLLYGDAKAEHDGLPATDEPAVEGDAHPERQPL